ncbi:MAG: hypothetical protein LBB12_01835 [Holosporaceae bacterium]|nr:hypothetical protein [Holosporaceae bacterium]
MTVSDEVTAILQEINEELKHDQQLAFFKRHMNKILGGIGVVVAFILIYSSWYARKQRHMEDITNTLINLSYSPATKSDLLLQELIEEAPAELKPILLIIKSGKQMILGEFSVENLTPLLELSQKSGVDIVWKDLALLIYASYPVDDAESLIKLLEPLTQENRPFPFMAMELIGMMKEGSGKHEEALEIFDKIINHKNAPKTLKNRISIIANYIRNSGRK